MRTPKASTTEGVRTPDQRLEALQRANAIRSRRARLKQELRAGQVNVVELILQPPAYLRRARVAEVLSWAPKLGKVKVERLLLLMRISATTRLASITERQRRELVNELVRRYPSAVQRAT